MRGGGGADGHGGDKGAGGCRWVLTRKQSAAWPEFLLLHTGQHLNGGPCLKTMEMPRRQTPLQLALFAVLTEIHGDTCDTYSPRHHGEKAPELRHTTGSLGAWPEL